MDELLHPVFNKEALKKAHVITKGLPASPGAACGRVVFFADEAEEWKKEVEAAFPGFTVGIAPLPLSDACHIGAGSLALACAVVL